MIERLAEALWLNGLVKIIYLFILIDVAFIMTRRDLLTLVTAYRVQSILLSALAVVLFVQDGGFTLISIAVLTIASKVVFIPWVMRRIQKTMNIHRDIEFHYLTPVSSLLVSIFLILLVYYAFHSLHDMLSSDLFFLGAVLGISLTLMGMLIIFSRRKAITKVLGYMTMENGVVLFSLFLTELPFIIEVLIILDLIMLVIMVTMLSFGLDASIEEFHHQLHHWFRRGQV